MPKMTNNINPKKRKYPHLKIEHIAHKHPRQIELNLKVKTREGTLITNATMDSNIEATTIPTEPSPDIERIITPPFTIKRYKLQRHVLVSDKNGKWLGRLEKHDLKNLFFEIGAMLRRIKNEKGEFELGETIQHEQNKET